MLGRTNGVVRRGLRTEALTRLQLDIAAAQNAAQDQMGEPAAAVEKSPEAVRGESLRGDVRLPLELQEAVQEAIRAADDGPALRRNALELYAHLRRTSSVLPPPSSYRDTQLAQPPTYDSPTSLAYLAGLMPAVYAATLHVLNMTRNRLELAAPTWSPQLVLDFGAGTASAAWAVDQVWPEADASATKKRQYVGLDSSRAMVELGSKLLSTLATRVVDDAEGSDAGSTLRRSSSGLESRMHQLILPASESSLARLELSRKNLEQQGRQTLALCAFGLGEIGTKDKRKELVRALWNSGAEVMIVIERGTPGGSRIVAEAREQLLMYGRREKQQLEDGPGDRVTDDANTAGGSYVLAPCPHDGACPLHHSTKSFCHFSQRVRAPPFLRQTKHSTRGEDDAKFSYVVIRRGDRPPSGVDLAAAAPQQTLADLLPELHHAVNLDKPPEPADVKSTEQGRELSWPRLVAPPMKRSGHVILEVCTSSGELQRHTIPKSQGRQEYYDARKTAWGDSFPHAPKNGPQPSPAALDMAQEAPTDKFVKGEKGRRRSKKAERRGEHMPGAELILGEGENGHARRRRGAWRKGTDRAGEVQDYEIEIGPDGQFKIM